MISMQQQSRSVNKPRSRPGGTLLACTAGVLLRVLLVFCLAHAMIPRITAGQGDSAGEYELKAAMLYNLAHFVEWPPSAYPDPQAPFQLCILGRDPFGSSLASILLKQTVNGRPVLVRHSQNDRGIRACHLLYVSSSERKATVQIFSTLKGSSVLTVGEMTQFAAHGGMIQFTLEDQQVRFEINVDAASRAGIKISSRVLVLARIIKDQGGNSENGHSAIPANPVTPGESARVTRHTVLEQQRSLCFLVAEDDAVNQRLITRLLEKRGHRVVLAQNGREAVQAFEKRHFDVVLMDEQMPEMDGFEATKLIRGKENATGTHLPIIALTALAMKGDEERCMTAGMDGCGETAQD